MFKPRPDRSLSRLLLASAILVALACGAAQAQKPPQAPAEIPDWAKLKAFYDYEGRKPPAVKIDEKPNDQAMVLHIEFNNPNGEKVTGLFTRPKARGVYPCVLLLHGLTSNKETMALVFGAPLAKQGCASLALDAPFHGERKRSEAEQRKPDNWPFTVMNGCRDYREALDWLQTRKDIDSKHIGLIGYSMGSMMGSILAAVEPRIRAAALCVGGDMTLKLAASVPETSRDKLYGVSPSLFVSHIAPRPLLMLNGTRDNTVPKEASDRLFNAAKMPKEQVWYESGHILPRPAAEKAISWIESKLKQSEVGHS